MANVKNMTAKKLTAIRKKTRLDILKPSNKYDAEFKPVEFRGFVQKMKAKTVVKPKSSKDFVSMVSRFVETLPQLNKVFWKVERNKNLVIGRTSMMIDFGSKNINERLVLRLYAALSVTSDKNGLQNVLFEVSIDEKVGKLWNVLVFNIADLKLDSPEELEEMYELLERKKVFNKTNLLPDMRNDLEMNIMEGLDSDSEGNYLELELEELTEEDYADFDEEDFEEVGDGFDDMLDDEEGLDESSPIFGARKKAKKKRKKKSKRYSVIFEDEESSDEEEELYEEDNSDSEDTYRTYSLLDSDMEENKICKKREEDEERDKRKKMKPRNLFESMMEEDDEE